MTHILSNLPEEYENIVENLEDKLDENIDMLPIKRIQDKLSAKYNRMNAWSNKNEEKIIREGVICMPNQGKVLQLWYIWAQK